MPLRPPVIAGPNLGEAYIVFNAMRNKLIHRVSAVIRKGVPYEIRTPLANVIE